MSRRARVLACSIAASAIVSGIACSRPSLEQAPSAEQPRSSAAVARAADRTGFPFRIASGDGGGLRVVAMATAPTGEVVVAASLTGRVELPFGAVVESAGADDVLVFAIDEAGALLWHRRFGDALSQNPTDLAIDAEGGIVLVGTVDGAIDFGQGQLQSHGLVDVFLAKLDRSGKAVWSRRFGDDEEQEASAVAVAPDGGIILVGSYEGEIDFGGGVLKSAGEDDVYVAKFNADGSPAWSQRFGDSASQKGRAVAIDEHGTASVAGMFRGTLRTRAASRRSDAADAPFVLTLLSDGTPSHLIAFQGERGSLGDPRGIAIAPDGARVLVGSLRGAFDFDGEKLRSADVSGFAARIDSGGHVGAASLLAMGPELAAHPIKAERGGHMLVLCAFSSAEQPGSRAPIARLSRDLHLAPAAALARNAWRAAAFTARRDGVEIFAESSEERPSPHTTLVRLGATERAPQSR